MNIQDTRAKIKTFLEDDRAFMAALLIAACAASFGLGRLSNVPQKGEGKPMESVLVQKASVRTSKAVEATSLAEETDSSGFVASKNGTKYHFPWCSGAKRITEANKISFKTKEEAEAAGYTPAANCPGL